jgi:hypothetical protein
MAETPKSRAQIGAGVDVLTNPLCICGRFMAKRGPKGYWYCRFCDWWYCQGEPNELALSRYLQSLTMGKSGIEALIRRRKLIRLDTLRRLCGDVSLRDFRRFLNELESEGKVAIQQSGYAGHSLYHGKLVVAR